MIDTTTLSRWRATAGVWAHFIKPSLLVTEVKKVPPAISHADTLSWIEQVAGSALIIDLPALEAVSVGIALAPQNWAVVPMFNTTSGPAEVVATSELVFALHAAAIELPQTTAGPPAFLLDANRQKKLGKRFIDRGDFDNRWYVFGSDFPSESFVLSQGIRSLIVVVDSEPIADDLHDALLNYKEINLQVLDVETGSLHPFPSPRPKLFRSISSFFRPLTRNPDGTFGRRRVPSSG